MHELFEISYHGAKIGVKFEQVPKATLLINGLVRDEGASLSANATLRLSTSLQTDYEWHEFVEVHLAYSTREIHVQLIANKSLLHEETYAREPKP